MNKENQTILSRLNALSDGIISYLMLPVAYWFRFYIMPNGISSIPLQNYLALGFAFTFIQLLTYAAFGLYQSFRNSSILKELSTLWRASLLDMALLLGWLFLGHEEHYSRSIFGIYLFLSAGTLSLKRVVLRKVLRSVQQNGKNLKRVIIIGKGASAQNFYHEILTVRDLGYTAIGYVAGEAEGQFELPYLGGFETLESQLECHNPDEVVSAIDAEDYLRTPEIIEACEKTGCKLAIIPFYAEYMPGHPSFDDLNGIPLLNIRHIPLDNFLNAFIKRFIDIVGSALLLILTSPLMLFCVIGVRLSSPGPVIFKQERVGKDKKPFSMYKFRSMRLNATQDSAWSGQQDSRRTKFGSFIRKCSIDELPQLYNVLKGDMSLVGPRPEIPHFVDQFKDEIPLYMIRHQVRPGITGWAQINGLRGDTSIKARIEYDIYYIENWSLLLDIQILLATVFKGKFINDEQL